MSSKATGSGHVGESVEPGLTFVSATNQLCPFGQIRSQLSVPICKMGILTIALCVLATGQSASEHVYWVRESQAQTVAAPSVS